MLKINAILIDLNFFIRNGNKWFHSTLHWFAIVISIQYSFFALNYVLKYIASNIESLTKINLNYYIIMDDHQLYYECLQLGTSSKKWDTKLGVTHKHDAFSVYCWHFIFFDLFFHDADVCIFAKTTALFSYIFIQEKLIVFTVSMKFAINWI